MAEPIFPVEIKTERLILRTPTPQDVQGIWELHTNNPNRIREAGLPALETYNKAEQAVAHWQREQAQNEEYKWYLYRHEQPDKPIGYVGAHEIDSTKHSATLACFIVKEFEGQKLMKEAVGAVVEMCDKQGFRLAVDIFASNTRSNRLADKLGFRQSCRHITYVRRLRPLAHDTPEIQETQDDIAAIMDSDEY